MKKREPFTFKVVSTKKYPFPIDMLRYDTAVPATEVDSSNIISSLSGEPAIGMEITLRYTGQGTRDSLTPKRWESFGWELR